MTIGYDWEHSVVDWADNKVGGCWVLVEGDEPSVDEDNPGEKGANGIDEQKTGEEDIEAVGVKGESASILTRGIKDCSLASGLRAVNFF